MTAVARIESLTPAIYMPLPISGKLTQPVPFSKPAVLIGAVWGGCVVFPCFWLVDCADCARKISGSVTMSKRQRTIEKHLLVY
jgi:hypothetical protein